uniref:Uncharacterized protein n=1 Tax=Oryza rufipogon TaxID=4529 RepID=A0A0E0QLQ9_ORYRU
MPSEQAPRLRRRRPTAAAASASTGGGETAWSYRCSACPDVELCLQCAMGRDGDGNGDDTTCLCGGADAGQGAVCAGIVAGKFIKGLMWGMGCGCGTPI